MTSALVNINEIFYSIQGESTRTGKPTIFIRLTGCPLRCVYCDTSYAFKGKNMLTVEEIINSISHYPSHFVTVTGGEPLAQKSCYVLLDMLIAQHYQVSLETSGSIDISAVNKKVMIVMDVKTPSSGEVNNNNLDNIKHLTQKDELKFVLQNRKDFNWIVSLLQKYEFKSEILFSPVYGKLDPAQLADWMLASELGKKFSVRLQIQLHKILWGEIRGK